MQDGTLLWHDFNNSVCDLTAERKIKAEDMLDKYQELFEATSLFNKKLYTQTGDVEQWGFENHKKNKQRDHMNFYSGKSVRKAQANGYFTPDVSWFYNHPQMVRRRKDGYHIEDDYGQDYYRQGFFMAYRLAQKRYVNAWSPS